MSRPLRPWAHRVLLLISAPGLLWAATALYAPHSDIDHIVSSFLQDEQIPGAVLAYGHAGTEPDVRAFGLADIATGRPMTPDVQLRIASLSKPLTAAATLQLVENKQLRLDDRLATWFPAVLDTVDERYAQITVRDLLRHSAGWDRDTTFDPLPDHEARRRELGIDKVSSCLPVALAMLGRTLQFSPGERYAYSNLGYCWLEQIIAAVSRRSYEGYVREEVLAPLGSGAMRIGEDGIPSNLLARYYMRGGGREAAVESSEAGLRPLGAAGGWTATVEQYFRFASRPIHPETVVKPAYGVRPGSNYYGLGWRVWPGETCCTLTHFGAMPGVYSIVIRTHDGLVIVAMFNGRPKNDESSFSYLLKKLPEAARKRLK